MEGEKAGSFHAQIQRALRISGPQGEIPIPLGFAQRAAFWWLLLHATLLGAVIGLFGAFMLYWAQEVPKMWYPCDFEYDVTCSCALPFHGNLYFILIVATGGMLVGTIRYIGEYKMDTPILFHEVLHCEGNLNNGIVTYCTNIISMMFGSALGPEMGLAGIATGLSEEYKKYLKFDDEDDARLLTLASISAAVGALVPSPIIGPLLCLELGIPPKEYMESLTVLSFAGVVSWFVCHSVSPIVITFDNSFTLNQDWEYDHSQLLAGVGFGVASAGVALLSMLIRILCKQVFIRLRTACALRNKFLAEALPCASAGAFIGLISYSLPLVVGPGFLSNRFLVKWGTKDIVPVYVLVLSLIGRLFSLGASMTSGFRGGPFISLVFLGLISGVITYRLCPSLPVGLCVSCFLAGVPSGLTAMPYLWAILTCNIFYLGYEQSIPVFTTAITAYLFSAGFGWLHMTSELFPIKQNTKPASMHSIPKPTHDIHMDMMLGSVDGSDSIDSVDGVNRGDRVDRVAMVDTSSLLPMTTASSYESIN